MRPRIIIDDVGLRNDSPTGIEVYTLELARFLDEEIGEAVDVRLARDVLGLRGRGRPLWRWLVSQPQIAREQAQVVIFPNFPPSPATVAALAVMGVKSIRVIHDTVPWEYPQFTSRKTRFVWAPLERILAPYYHRVVTVSRYSQRRLSRVFPRLKAPPVNGGQMIRALQVAREAPNMLDPCVIGGRPYFLMVGTVEPRKNLEMALRSLSLMAREQVILVVAGRRGWGGTDYNDLARRLGVSDRVVWLDYVSSSALAHLYRNALALLMPSHQEGFGMPSVEAMAFGLPVIASDNSALPEVVADGGMLVDPTDARQWAATMDKLVGDPDLLNVLRTRAVRRYETVLNEQYLAACNTWPKLLEELVQ